MWAAAPGLPSHMQLVWAIKNRDVSVIRNQVQEILAQRHQYVVISCEALSRLDQNQVVQFRHLLGPAPAQVVYYVRRPSERLPSLWQESVKFGLTTAFPEFLAEQLTRFAESEFRDAAAIDTYAAVFGATQVKVVSYSHLVDNDLDIAGHFLASFLGLSDIELPDVGRPNQSLSILDTELIRALNAIHTRHGGERSAALRNWYLAYKEGLAPDSMLDSMRDNLGAIRMDERWPPLVLASRDVLTRYASSIVPPWHKDTLHELRVTDVPYVRQDYLLDPAVPKILGDIYEMYLRAL
jgi:hypothetical protein